MTTSRRRSLRIKAAEQQKLRSKRQAQEMATNPAENPAALVKRTTARQFRVAYAKPVATSSSSSSPISEPPIRLTHPPTNSRPPVNPISIRTHSHPAHPPTNKKRRVQPLTDTYHYPGWPATIKPEHPSDTDPSICSSIPDYMPGPSHSQPAITYPQASLLGLPGELRNTIMRLALHEDDLILIDAGTATQPGVLRACRQLRKEGRGIWEVENSFYVEAWDLKLRIPPNSEKHWILGLNYKISLKGSKNWDNLKKWLEEYYECNYRGLADGQPTQWSQTVALAFRMVDDLRKKVRGFREIEPVLESWMLSLELLGLEWDHTTSTETGDESGD